jgi:hypothetical protein
VPAQHLHGDCGGDVVESEEPGLFSHAGMKDDVNASGTALYRGSGRLLKPRTRPPAAERDPETP